MLPVISNPNSRPKVFVTSVIAVNWYRLEGLKLPPPGFLMPTYA